MLSTVSQINNNQAYRINTMKKVSFKENKALSVESKDVFQKEQDVVTNEQKLTEQQKRFLAYYLGSTIVIGALIGGCVGFFSHKHGGLNLFGNKAFKFKSLANDTKIPTLNNCKSINKDLKLALQKQLKLANADKDIVAEMGGFDSTNRFLLSGPPGVGKTHFSKIYAKTLDAEYLEILYSDLNSRWVGESAEKIRDAFVGIINQAKKNPDKKYVVTFNEFDSILLPVEQLTGGSGSTNFASLRRQRSTFLTHMDKLQEYKNVTVIGTTNMPIKSKNLDGATMSRFQNILELPYPDEECLFEAIKANLSSIKNNDEFLKVNEAKLKHIAKTMAERKFSFRNAENVINEAKTNYIMEKFDNRSTNFKAEYLEDALKNFKKSDGEI